jgi:hypothetical protein
VSNYHVTALDAEARSVLDKHTFITVTGGTVEEAAAEAEKIVSGLAFEKPAYIVAEPLADSEGE